jgi:CSLREA domain-containing protein
MIRSIRTRAAVLTLLAAASAAPVRAAVFEVTKLGDTADGACDRDCSLREAITAANNLDGPDVILLGPGIHLVSRAGAGEDANAGGDLDILDDLTVVGKTPALTVLSSGGGDRVLHVAAGVTAELRGVSVANGRVAGSGGGILNLGRLTLSEVTVLNNATTAGGSGGGIRSDGPGASLTLADSAVINNTAEGAGGGVIAGGTLELANVTISGNRSTAGFGGGLYTFDSLDADISNSTITANGAQRGGGLYVESVPFLTTDYPELRNTILAGNTAANDADCAGAAVSRGYNLLGVGGGCIDFKAAKNDLVGTAAAPLNPRLQALGSGGGFTPSHAPLGNSPALNAGNPAPPGEACEAYDQRGLKRTGRCDIGAVELLAAGCVEGDLGLCLNANNRFQVTTVFTDGRVQQPAHAVETTRDTGYFWFFDPTSVEVTVKILNGCGSNGRYWVYLAGLTNVGATVTVTDTVTGATKTYTSPHGRNFRPMYDTNFAPCGS